MAIAGQVLLAMMTLPEMPHSARWVSRNSMPLNTYLISLRRITRARRAQQVPPRVLVQVLPLAQQPQVLVLITAKAQRFYTPCPSMLCILYFQLLLLTRCIFEFHDISVGCYPFKDRATFKLSTWGFSCLGETDQSSYLTISESVTTNRYSAAVDRT